MVTNQFVAFIFKACLSQLKIETYCFPRPAVPDSVCSSFSKFQPECTTTTFKIECESLNGFSLGLPVLDELSMQASYKDEI